MRYLVCCLWLSMGLTAGLIGCTHHARASDPTAATTNPKPPPTDNPVASYYHGHAGYPAWTDTLGWSRVIDMSLYPHGRTNFEKFEHARDYLAEIGGGVLYYPAGVYDFSDAPGSGPDGRGLMLRSGVIIRGQTPVQSDLRTGKIQHLPTRFQFGFDRRTNAVDTQPRLALVMDHAMAETQQRTVKQKQPDGSFKKIPKTVVRHRTLLLDGDTNDLQIPEQFQISCPWQKNANYQSRISNIHSDAEGIRFDLTVYHESSDKAIGEYHLNLTQDQRHVSGTYTGTCHQIPVKGHLSGRRVPPVNPATPRDWNIVGLMPEPGKGIGSVDRVGIAWVQLDGAAIWFGPQVDWYPTWGKAKSWKSPYVKPAWQDRVPDGSHPWDVFVGGGRTFKASGSGRLVFGCLLKNAVVTNNSITMGRTDRPEGFGPDGYYMHKFAPRIGVYGDRILIANNAVLPSFKHNFKYRQPTRYTYPKGGAGIGLGEIKTSTILFDYNKAAGIDVNKDALGLTKTDATSDAGNGYFKPGIVIRDNYVYNHGHKGYNISGAWVSVINNINDRAYLKEHISPCGLNRWELTLDGHLESAPGGNGAISDNLSRAFDLGGKYMWIHGNQYNNTGSTPGNDGEGILCQSHGGTHLWSWAITYNTHQRDQGEAGYIGGWDVKMAGALFGWNRIPGWVGSINVTPRNAIDVSFAGNQVSDIKAPPGAVVNQPLERLPAPANITLAIGQPADHVIIRWSDACDGETGYRVQRRLGTDGPWQTIAYRPAQNSGSTNNPPSWHDFTAPPKRDLYYRVCTLDCNDDDRGASQSVGPIQLK